MAWRTLFKFCAGAGGANTMIVRPARPIIGSTRMSLSRYREVLPTVERPKTFHPAWCDVFGHCSNPEDKRLKALNLSDQKIRRETKPRG